MQELTPGKARGLQRISDGEGRYAVVAVDQRPPIFGFLESIGTPQSEVKTRAGAVKRVIAEGLASSVTGLLVDPVYGYDRVMPVLPRETGLLLTLEDHAFRQDEQGYRLSDLIPGWSAQGAAAAGADAMKFLVWHRPDAPESVVAAQLEVVRQVGDACRAVDRPLVLEILTYQLPGEDDAAYAERMPALLEASIQAFAAPEFGVDLYKLPLPGEAAAVTEWGGSHYSLQELARHMKSATKDLRADWVLLSAGVTAQQFAQALDAGLSAGARGFMAGRALWWQPLQAYPDEQLLARELNAMAEGPLKEYNQMLRSRLEPRRVEGAALALTAG